MVRSLLLVAFGLVPAVAVAAIEMPARKPGLWELKIMIERPGVPAQTMQHCVDAETDKLMNANFGNMRSEMCAKQEMKKVGATIVVDSVCTVGQATMTTHAVVTGDFNSAYTVKVNSKRTGGTAAPGTPDETNINIEAKWAGACAADQKPGDMILPGGRRVNIRDMPRAAPGR